MELPNEFFTIQSMLTLTGATTATLVIANSLQHAFGYNPKWLALLIALLLSILGTYFTGGEAVDYFVGLVNGFLIYSSTLGLTIMTNGTTAAATARTMKAQGESNASESKRKFFTPWI